MKTIAYTVVGCLVAWLIERTLLHPWVQNSAVADNARKKLAKEIINELAKAARA